MIHTGTTYSYSGREEWGMVRKDEGKTEVYQANTTYSVPCLASETLVGSVWALTILGRSVPLVHLSLAHLALYLVHLYLVTTAQNVDNDTSGSCY